MSTGLEKNGEFIDPQVLLNGYLQGIFPMAEGEDILWFSPEMRGVIPLDKRFHINHGLRKVLRKERFEVRFNTNFEEVMRACAQRDETWIDERIIRSYCLLHRLGYAHSVECWDAEGLQGGLYGVQYKRAFFGESMFSRKADASKVAVVALVEKLRREEALLLDTQWLTEHLKSFGGYELPRDEYLCLLAEATAS